MGLDAVVYCDCYEKGRTRTPPPQPDLVYVDRNGQVCLKWYAVGADQNAFYDWLKDACDHGPTGDLVWHRLGNVATIGAIRSLLAESGQEFPVLLTKVVYDGSHAGDWLTFGDVEHLPLEIQRLSAVHAVEEVLEAVVRKFEEQMSELVTAAMRTPEAYRVLRGQSLCGLLTFPNATHDRLSKSSAASTERPRRLSQRLTTKAWTSGVEIADAINQPPSWKPPPIMPSRARTAATKRPGNAPGISGTNRASPNN